MSTIEQDTSGEVPSYATKTIHGSLPPPRPRHNFAGTPLAEYHEKWSELRAANRISEEPSPQLTVAVTDYLRNVLNTLESYPGQELFLLDTLERVELIAPMLKKQRENPGAKASVLERSLGFRLDPKNDHGLYHSVYWLHRSIEDLLDQCRSDWLGELKDSLTIIPKYLTPSIWTKVLDVVKAVRNPEIVKDCGGKRYTLYQRASKWNLSAEDRDAESEIEIKHGIITYNIGKHPDTFEQAFKHERFIAFVERLGSRHPTDVLGWQAFATRLKDFGI